MKKPFSTIVFVAALSQVGATDCGNALRDPGFDLWCGDSLCAWKLERGNIVRVATWNEGDPGVELVGADVAIEQLSPVASTDGTCLEFDLIANVDENADVELNIDVNGDGAIEHAERLPTSHWKPLAYKILLLAPYSGIRFELAKTGSGHATLANIGARTTDGCDGLMPLDGRPTPLGAPCAADADCTSGICDASPILPPFSGSAKGVCIGCDLAHGCSIGSVCGLGDPVSPVRAVPAECVPAAARELGEQCIGGDECASGICTYNVCSTCAIGGCGSGETCGPAWDTPYGVNSVYVCNPNARQRAKGEPCGSDYDCASGSCAGTTRMQCDDGRSCATAANCPFGTAETANGLENGPCDAVESLPSPGDGPESPRAVGIQGGSCQ